MRMNWIVMPFVDNLGLTERAVRDCLDQTIDVKLLLIDQGSRPEIYDEVYQWQVDERIFLWHHQPPLPSLSATWNQALRFIWSTKQGYALVVNNDIRLPRGTYEGLLEVLDRTDSWFVSAVNVGPAWYDGMLGQSPEITESLLASRGGPDFSCYLINWRCHDTFQFDEAFVPAYHEDNDYHRRLQLAGFGDKIFSVPIPYWHLGSGTLRHVERIAKTWAPKFERCQAYYQEKWGGLPGSETYTVPFNRAQRDGETGFADHRILYTGQGRYERTDQEYARARQELYG